MFVCSSRDRPGGGDQAATLMVETQWEQWEPHVHLRVASPVTG